MKKDNIIHVKSADSGQNTIARVIVGNKISHNPTVSVIMPVYNVAPYLRQCMDSVVNQTLRDIEIICVDDNSTDDSLEILREYAAHDNRITILHQENLRAGAARNAGLAVARGEYLSFLDSDDFFESDMLESMVSKMTKTNADMVMCNCFLYNDSEQRDECVPWTLRSDLAPDVFSYTDLPNDIFSLSNCWVWNRMYRRSFIMENDIRFQNLGVANDTYFSCIATATAKRIAILDRRLIHYRTKQAGKQNVTSVKFRQTFPTDLLKCFADIYNKLCEMGVYNTLKNSYMRVMTEHVYWSRNAFVNDASLYSQFTKYLSDNYAQIFDTVLPFDSDTLNQKYIVLRNILVDGGVFHEIPRRVFYVWGANEPKRPEVQRCINSWLKYLPYYEIVEINENSTNYFNFQTELKSNRWFRTVYNRKMWAYVADYIRIKALYDNGGIYFDTDVSVLKNMDKFLNNQAFVGIQMSSIDGTGDWVEPAICGARRGNKLFGQIVDFYNEKIWTEPIYTMPQIFNYFLRRYDIFPFPEKQNQEIIHLPEITLYPERYFIPYRFRSKYTDDCIEPDTHTVHWWGGSWVKPAVLHFLQNKSKIWDNHDGARVSVIIPVYNVEKYLAQCLDSVINQTLRDIEIICVNDGSTDGSLEILKQYAARDNRIKIINQSNQGLSCSRNNALKIATGEYVLFVDSDDWIDLNTCTELYEYSKIFDLDMLNYSGINYYMNTDTWRQQNGQKANYVNVPQDKGYLSPEQVMDIIEQIPISACRMFYKLDFIRNSNLTFPSGLCFEDNYFVLNALIHVQRYSLYDRVLYYRRMHDKQITANWDKLFGDFIEIIKQIDLLLYSKIDFPAYCRVMNKYCESAKNIYLSLNKNIRGKYIKNLYHCIQTISKKAKLNDSVNEFIYLIETGQLYANDLLKWYKSRNNKLFNLNRPRTFNEKIQYLKLYDSTPIKTRLADKLLVRDWVSQKIGDKYLIPLLGVYDQFDDIDFSKLPKQFVIKCNHGSGWNMVVRDKSKLNIAEVKETFDKWMHDNFAFKVGCELHYRDIPPKIIIEKFVTNNNKALYDYKFWCFNGKVKYMQFRDDFSSDLKMVFYDLKWRKQPFYYDHPMYENDLDRPNNFDEMVDIAKILCQGFAFVCVDLYRLNDGTIKFGEMTFTRSSGSGKWNKKKYDLKMGKLIKLPKRAYNIDIGVYYKLPRHRNLISYLLFPYYYCMVKILHKRLKRNTDI